MHTFKLFQTGFYEVKLRVAIDFHSKENIWKSMATINCLVRLGYQHSSKYEAKMFIFEWTITISHLWEELWDISQQLEKNAKIVK